MTTLQQRIETELRRLFREEDFSISTNGDTLACFNDRWGRREINLTRWAAEIAGAIGA